MAFFNGFDFDTLLATISCLTGVVALFVGGAAYNNCKISRNTVESQKKIDGGSVDNSTNVGGDYTHNEGVSENGLLTVMDKMKEMNSESFSLALDNAYTMFQNKCDDNLHRIIDETKRIVLEQKFDIAGYTKIDWIHIYFESAKNTSDAYMQNVWAKVLARELSYPDSFSYKTLDALKNMSETEFKLFEKLSMMNVNGVIYTGDYLDENGFSWVTLQKLKEFGLISLDGSQRTISVEPQRVAYQIINKQYVIVFKNENDEKVDNEVESYLLTSVAEELLSVIYKVTDISVALSVASKAREVCKKCTITLHKVYRFSEETGAFDYSPIDILSKQTGGSNELTKNT